MEFLVRDIVERSLILNNTETRFILIAIAWGIPIIAAGLAGSSGWQWSLVVLALYIIAYRRIVRCHYLLGIRNDMTRRTGTSAAH